MDHILMIAVNVLSRLIADRLIKWLDKHSEPKD